MNVSLLDNQRRLKQDIFYCMFSGEFENRKYVGSITRDVPDFTKEQLSKTTEFDFKMTEYIIYEYEPSCIVYSRKIIECLPKNISQNVLYNRQKICVHKLAKGTQIPDEFDVIFNFDDVKIKIIPINPEQNCIFYYLQNQDSLYTFTKITNLNWEFYGYIDKNKTSTFPKWFHKKHKNKQHVIHRIPFTKNVTRDVNNCVDAMFFCYLTKWKNIKHSLLYTYLREILYDYIDYSDYFDQYSDINIFGLINKAVYWKKLYNNYENFITKHKINQSEKILTYKLLTQINKLSKDMNDLIMKCI